MKAKIYILIAVLSITALSPIQAQQIIKNKNGAITIRQFSTERQGDSIHIDMIMDMSKLAVSTKRSMMVSPVMTDNSGQSSVFRGIIINGKMRHKAYKRQLAFGMNMYPEAYQVLVRDKNLLKEIRYRQSVPWESWMRDARWQLKEELCGCSGYTPVIMMTDIAGFTKRKSLAPLVSYIRPDAEKVKNRTEQQEAYLNFQIGKSVVLPDFRNNRHELNKVFDMLDKLKEDNSVKVKSITLRGYTSPEGQVTTNKALSFRRAIALKDYLSPLINFPSLRISTEGAGEDWKKLRMLIEESNVSLKRIALSVIDECGGGSDECERLLQAIPGSTYKEIYAGLYPKLRRVVCSVEYTVKGFSTEEGQNRFSSNPKSLSLEEIFLVANSYEPESDDFQEALETAVRLYPNDKTANLNAAAAALSRKDLRSADKYLLRSSDKTSEYFNNKGIFHLLKDEYQQAIKYFQQAIDNQDTGSEAARNEANHNMELAKGYLRK